MNLFGTYFLILHLMKYTLGYDKNKINLGVQYCATTIDIQNRYFHFLYVIQHIYEQTHIFLQ